MLETAVCRRDEKRPPVDEGQLVDGSRCSVSDGVERGGHDGRDSVRSDWTLDRLGKGASMTVAKLDSIFDADCPKCGLPLEPKAATSAAEGLIWRCPECDFRSERSGSVLIDSRRGPQPADR